MEENIGTSTTDEVQDPSSQTLSGKKDIVNEPTAQKPDTEQQQQQQPITVDGDKPQKKFYRSRAHCNPLSHNDSFEHPLHPDLMDWTTYFPAIVRNNESTKVVPEVLDIGCGFGGLTIALSTLLPEKLILGLEIRAKVAEYVRLRILACRRENNPQELPNGPYENCSVLRSNTMKFMPHFFHKASIEKIFFCFPDPHFKRKNHPRRIVSERLLSEYAYFLKPGGRLYTITDVEDLHNWHLDKCRSHPLYRELSPDELSQDSCVHAMYSETEEGKKVERNSGKKYYAVYERISQEDLFRKTSAQVNADNFWNDGEFGVYNACEDKDNEKADN